MTAGTTPATMADYLRSCGSETGDAIAAELEAQASAIELAYVLLWSTPVDTTTPTGWLTSQARQTLLQVLDKQGQARGISEARKAVRDFPESRKNSRTIGVEPSKPWPRR